MRSYHALLLKRVEDSQCFVIIQSEMLQDVPSQIQAADAKQRLLVLYEFKEGMAAPLDKRPPEFEGR